MFIANDTKANHAVTNLIKRTETGLETNFGNPAKKFVPRPKNTAGAKIESKNIFGKRPPPRSQIMEFCKCPTFKAGTSALRCPRRRAQRQAMEGGRLSRSFRLAGRGRRSAASLPSK